MITNIIRYVKIIRRQRWLYNTLTRGWDYCDILIENYIRLGQCLVSVDKGSNECQRKWISQRSLSHSKKTNVVPSMYYKNLKNTIRIKQDKGYISSKKSLSNQFNHSFDQEISFYNISIFHYVHCAYNWTNLATISHRAFCQTPEETKDTETWKNASSL